MNVNNNEIFISFIICTIGRYMELVRCICSINLQKGNIKNYEIIVVDQSGEKFIKEICSNNKRIRYIFSSQVGLSRNRNFALSKARGKWITFLDDDAWIDPNYLLNLKNAVKELFGARIIIADALRSDSKRFYVKNFDPKKTTDEGKIRRSLYFSICSISIVFSKDIFDIVGNFDPKFGVGSSYPSCEETDMLLRVASKKIDIYYLGGIIIYHPPLIIEYSFKRIKKAYLHAQGHGALFRKHFFNNDMGKYYFILKFLQAIVGSIVQSIVHIYSPYRAIFHLRVLVGKIKGFICYNNE